ncbi:hypothetical protein NITMOv2_3696 [Nitrospira moscoviensis]|uniref:Uncharacterized protein n=1 Tax=Nitrospira moscoviensis TaxID=42253 RepID=A0A0K2GGJ6_NITMO|nr:hypothetical protein NITMOv2_3696 [Nitrospira moscoviensis]
MPRSSQWPSIFNCAVGFALIHSALRDKAWRPSSDIAKLSYAKKTSRRPAVADAICSARISSICRPAAPGSAFAISVPPLPAPTRSSDGLLSSPRSPPPATSRLESEVSGKLGLTPASLPSLPLAFIPSGAVGTAPGAALLASPCCDDWASPPDCTLFFEQPGTPISVSPTINGTQTIVRILFMW